MHKLFFTFCICILVLFPVKSYSQVELQTGGVDFSIPFFNYLSPDKRLSTSLSLEYTSQNGIKVNQLASDVGLGWDLNFGGEITRIQRGEPDDQPAKVINNFTPWKGYYNVNTINYQRLKGNHFSAGYLFNNYSSANPISSKYAYRPLYFYNINSYKETEYEGSDDISGDNEQDIFSFRIGNIQGEFVIGKNFTTVIKGANNYKIIFYLNDLSQQNIYTQISSFVITDDNGIKYFFEDYDLSELSEPKRNRGFYFDANGQPCAPPPIYQYGGSHIDSVPIYTTVGFGKYSINRWHLSKIQDPRTGALISFTYGTRNKEYILSRDITLASDRNLANGLMIYKFSINEPKYFGVEKYILSINFPSNEKWLFGYANSINRIDLPNCYPIQSIEKQLGSAVIEKYHFNYKYFLKTELVSTDYAFQNLQKKYARLCLNNITREIVGANKPYRNFTYYLKSTEHCNSDPANFPSDQGVPPRLSYQQDWYGYYNSSFGDNTYSIYNDDNLGGDMIFYYRFFWEYVHENSWLAWCDYLPLRSNSVSAKNGMLESVEDENGGVFKYEYQLNNKATQDSWGNVIHGPGVVVSKTSEISGNNSLVKKYDYTDDNGNSTFWNLEKPIVKYTTLYDINLKPLDANSTYQYLLSVAKSAKASYIKDFSNNLIHTGSLVQSFHITLETSCRTILSILEEALVGYIYSLFSGSSPTLFENESRENQSSLAFNPNFAIGIILPKSPTLQNGA